MPNPFLPQIVEEWNAGRSANSTYHREPFATDVSEGKGDAIYSAHSYHTKVPHKAIMRYILHYTEPGDIVFDGFCGSGMTGVAAQLCGDRKAVQELGYTIDDAGIISDGGQSTSRLGARKVVLNDLSPAATFIAYNYNTPVDVPAFEREAQRILRDVLEELGWMYETWHPNCDDLNRVKATVNEYVWSDVFVCSNCGVEIVFWSSAVDLSSGQVKQEFACPTCRVMLKKQSLSRAHSTVVDLTSGQPIIVAKQIPVRVSYKDRRREVHKDPDAEDLGNLERTQESQIPYWFPTSRIDKDIDLWYERDYRSLGVFSIDAFFTKRNLWWLSALWNRAAGVTDKRLRNAATYTLTGMQVNLSRLNRWRPNVSFPYNPLSGTLYLGSLQAEANVFIGVENKARRLAQLWRSLPALRTDNVALTTQAHSSALDQIEDDSLDYVFTDPPFGSNIIYSDLSIIWEAWLSVFTCVEHETVVHRRKKTGATSLRDYRDMMRESFRQIYRVLKPGRWATVEFHNTKNAVWVAIQDAIIEAGLVIADVRMLDKETSSFKQVTALGAVKQDLIISAYKPSADFERQFLLHLGSVEGVWDFVRQHLAQLPIVVRKGSTLEVIAERQNYLLFDRMVAYHIRRGMAVPIGAAQFYAGLNRYFVARDGMFFLPDQVAEYDRARMDADSVAQVALFVSDEKSTITWLRVQLGAKPQTFKEIQPRYLQDLHKASHEELPDLRVLLDENFLQDDAGRWYVPDPNRAEDLEKLRVRGLLREFETYKQGRKKLTMFRSEAVRAGFSQAWGDKDYQTIIQVAERLPETVLQEDPDLLMYYDTANLRM